MHQTCESCGARIDAGAEVCNLCGTPVAGVPQIEVSQERDSSQESSSSPVEGLGIIQSGDLLSDVPPECDTCGHRNPGGSRFCNRCGSRLVPNRAIDSGERSAGTIAPASQVIAEARESKASHEGKSGKITDLGTTDKAVGKQVIIVVSAALLLVVALYAVTTMSGGSGGSFDSIAQPSQDQQTVRASRRSGKTGRDG